MWFSVDSSLTVWSSLVLLGKEFCKLKVESNDDDGVSSGTQEAMPPEQE